MGKAKTSSLVLRSALSKEGVDRGQMNHSRFKLNMATVEVLSLLFLFNLLLPKFYPSV